MDIKVKPGVSYWRVFRLIFVVFSLYLVGDAFYRWDGFRYYATFSEFLPGVALTAILWSLVAVFTALLVWLPVRALEWFCRRMGWKIKAEHFLFFIVAFSLLGTAIWIYRHRIWDIIRTQREVLFLCITLAAIFFTWLLRNKAERWMGALQERITPLVWLFGILVIFSVPLVAYHTWGKETDKAASQRISRSSTADWKKPNIILVTFDALTARDMSSAYGYYRDTTPFIGKWAEEASLFTRVEAESNLTTPAVFSLMTGKRVWSHQTYHIKGSKVVDKDIASLLKKNGYYNMAFIANISASVRVLGIDGSFDIAPVYTEFSVPASLLGVIDKTLYQLFGDKIKLYDWIIKADFILHRFIGIVSRNLNKTVVPPENVFEMFLRTIDGNIQEPYFAWIHVLPPHDPYLPPEPYMGMYNSSSEVRTLKSQWNLFKTQYYPPEAQSTINVMRARYDEFIRYCDKQFEDFISQLAKRNRLKNTVIILSSDHGESFEDNYLGHGGPYLFEQLTYIPLIIKEPGQRKGQIINDLTGQVDIASTIVDLANIPVPLWMEGRSLVPLLRGKRLSNKPIFSMNLQKNRSLWHEIRRGTIAVWEGNYKLIHYLEENKSLLFNLRVDPDEQNNLFDKEPVVGQHLLKLIQDNIKKANERISTGEK